MADGDLGVGVQACATQHVSAIGALTLYVFLIQIQVVSSIRVLAGLEWVLLVVSVEGGKACVGGFSRWMAEGERAVLWGRRKE